ncbi:MAG: WbqC family protein [Fluviicola sp.]|jgi:hypothetical protein
MEPFPLSGFGPLAYFQQLAKAKEVVFEVNDHFPKQTFRSRFSIVGPNGVQRISIPLIRDNGSKTLTKAVRISYDTNWIVEAKRSLKTAYSASPYFDHYEQDIFDLLDRKQSSLVEFNLSIIDFLNAHLDLNIEYKLSSTFTEFKENDPRGIDFENNAFLLDKTEYQQVLFNENKFESNLSILDCLFNLGPLSRTFIHVKK